jgi:hypothetical protein
MHLLHMSRNAAGLQLLLPVLTAARERRRRQCRQQRSERQALAANRYRIGIVPMSADRHCRHRIGTVDRIGTRSA